MTRTADGLYPGEQPVATRAVVDSNSSKRWRDGGEAKQWTVTASLSGSSSDAESHQWGSGGVWVHPTGASWTRVCSEAVRTCLP